MANRKVRKQPESHLIRERRRRANSLRGRTERFWQDILRMPGEMSLRVQALEVGSLLHREAETRETPVAREDEIIPERSKWGKEVGFLEDAPGLTGTPQWWGVLPEDRQFHINSILDKAERGDNLEPLFEIAQAEELTKYAAEAVHRGLKGWMQVGTGRERNGS